MRTVINDITRQACWIVREIESYFCPTRKVDSSSTVEATPSSNGTDTNLLVPQNTKESLFRRSRRNILFLHVPKCGGSFVEQAFLPWIRRCPSRRIRDARGHLTYCEYTQVFDRHRVDLASMHVFTVVRNPWAWHVSWFHYLKEDYGRGQSGMPTEVELFQDYDFSDYLRWLADDEAPTSPTRYIRKQQLDYLTDASGTVAVDRILRQERLADDLARMATELDLAVTVPQCRANSSSHGHYREYYDDFGIDLVARRHRDDIETFGYTF
ncbi:sulfotransferase family 2 domain-containing protein [Stappia indica]|uniref:sulfotransferase family 2 domain-containing protein n=1 Tax=Stappia indica TaxID=538381 RepID=UPI001D181C7D|nr:sulfotransferase family 2 domain-containing protein [Stappia indica]MCC4243036.1 sulfotransferase family 2 domain-containing protein [Stappia indica]